MNTAPFSLNNSHQLTLQPTQLHSQLHNNHPKNHFTHTDHQTNRLDHNDPIKCTIDSVDQPNSRNLSLSSRFMNLLKPSCLKGCLHQIKTVTPPTEHAAHSEHPSTQKRTQHQTIDADHIPKKTAYARMVMPIYREQAARVIQHFIRQQLGTTYNNSYRETLNGDFRLNCLTEPTDTTLATQLAEQIHTNNYCLVDYSAADFDRSLFQAFRLNKINEKQFMNAKLLYDALKACNGNTVPNDWKNHLTRHTLNSETGPLNLQHFDSEKAVHPLPELPLENATDNHHYYTVSLSRRMMVAFLYMGIDSCTGKSFIGFRHALLAYIYSSYSPEQSRKVRRKLDKHDKITPTIAQYIKNIILITEPNLNEYLSTYYSFRHSVNHSTLLIKKEANSIAFLLAIYKTGTSMPTISFSRSNPQQTYQLIIPTIESYNLLLDSIHPQERITSMKPIAGQFNPRLIRAMDELPNHTHHDLRAQHSESKQTWQQAEKTHANPVTAPLKALYPEQLELSKQSRPIEVSHPDLKSSPAPHGYHCFDFFLSLHDLYHSWQNSNKLKAPIRRLREVLSEKAGFTQNQQPHLMSQAIWHLTDMDFYYSPFNAHDHFSAEACEKAFATLSQKDHLSTVKSELFTEGLIFLNFLSTSDLLTLNPSKDDEQNELLILEFLNNATFWKPYFAGLELDDFMNMMLFHASEQNHELYNKLIHGFHRKLSTVQSIKADFPTANTIELIILRLGRSTQPHLDQALFNAIHTLPLKSLIYWSINSGLYFRKEILDQLPKGTKPKLSLNSAATLREAFNHLVTNYKSDGLLYFQTL